MSASISFIYTDPQPCFLSYFFSLFFFSFSFQLSSSLLTVIMEKIVKREFSIPLEVEHPSATTCCQKTSKLPCMFQSQSSPQTSNIGPSYLLVNGFTRTHRSEQIEARSIDQTMTMVGTLSCFPIIPFRNG